MFGNNPIRHQVLDLRVGLSPALAIEPPFYTIQGEGPLGGTPALFLRLSGCNLACTFCDTEFERHAEKPRSIAALLAHLQGAYSEAERHTVVLTGGEPLRQNVIPLIEGLLASGTRMIQIETAGTLWIDGLQSFLAASKLMLVCSPKTPKVHPEIVRHCEHWKYIIKAGEVDALGLPNRGTQAGSAGKEQTIFRPGWAAFAREGRDVWGTIWLSPCDEYDPDKNRANQDLARDLCMKHGYRLSLQVHKIIGVE